MTVQTMVTAVVPVDQSKNLSPGQSANKADLEQILKVGALRADSIANEDFSPAPMCMTRGTYSVHNDECYSVPDFYESAYAKRHPWQEYNHKFSAGIGQRGHYRSLFTPGGNYKNFYDIFAMSRAPSFHEGSVVPTFYAPDENCTETTISLPRKGREFENYRPFAIEPRGYTRSYFYGAAR